MAGVTRLELATSGVTGQRSNRLSYTPKLIEERYPYMAIYTKIQRLFSPINQKESVGL